MGLAEHCVMWSKWRRTRRTKHCAGLHTIRWSICSFISCFSCTQSCITYQLMRFTKVCHVLASSLDQCAGYTHVHKCTFNSTCLMFCSFQIMPVVYIILSKKRFLLHEFLAFPGRYLYPDSIFVEDEEYYYICSHHMDRTMRSFLYKATILSTSAGLSVIWPSYQSLTAEAKITSLQLKFPFIEENSYAEFAGNILLECNILGHGFLGYVAIEVGMDIVTDYVAISRSLLQYRLKKMFRAREANGSANIIPMLGDIVRCLQNFDKYGRNNSPEFRWESLLILFVRPFFIRYVHCLGQLFYWRSLFVPTLYTYAIGMGIFVQFTVIYVN